MMLFQIDTPSASPTGSDVSSLTPSLVDTDGNFSFSSSVVEPPVRTKVGNTTFEEGWSLTSAVSVVSEAPREVPLYYHVISPPFTIKSRLRRVGKQQRGHERAESVAKT